MKDRIATIGVCIVLLTLIFIANRHDKRLERLEKHNEKHGVTVEWESSNKCSFSFCCPEDWAASTTIIPRLKP